MVFNYGKSEALMLPRPYIDFVELIKHLREAASPPHKVSVLTFNYDIVVDVACYLGGLPIDYRLDEYSG